MATQFDTLEDPAVLTMYARDLVLALAETDGLAQWAPVSFIEDVVFSIESLVNMGIPVAELRSYDAAGKILDRQFGHSVKTMGIAPITGSIVMNEYDRLRLRANADNLLIQQAYNDLDSAVRAVWQRIRLLTGEAMSMGKLTIAEGGVSDVIDFGDNASRKATAGTSWTDTVNANAWTDHADVCAAYEDLNGFAPAVAYASTATIRLFQKNAEVQGNTAPVNTARIMSLGEVNNVLEADALCPFVPFNEKVNSDLVFPANSVIYMPPGNLEAPSARRVFGISSAVGTAVDIQGSGEAGIAAYEAISTDPVQIKTVADALFMPAVVPNHFYNFTR